MSKAAELAKWGEVSTNGQVSGRRNIVINGAMQVAQRGTSVAGVTGSGVYAVDRMALGMENLGAYTVAQETLTSGNAYNAGFKKAFRVDCTTADASPASDDSLFFQYKLEGQDMNGFKKGTSEAEKFTLQFWVKSNKTGTGQVVLFDDNSRAVGKTYTISSANTWEHKVLTFPADTSGAIDNDNTKGFEIEWALDAGSTFQGGTLPATWGSSNNNFRSINDFAIGDNTNNDWAITGIQLEVGSVATPFEHRSFGEELALCQRYCFAIDGAGLAGSDVIASGHCRANNAAYVILHFPVTMRVKASSITVNTVGHFGMVTYGVINLACTTVALQAASRRVASINLVGSTTSLTIGFGCFMYHINDDGLIVFEGAEL
jgi:hypothetical protein